MLIIALTEHEITRCDQLKLQRDSSQETLQDEVIEAGQGSVEDDSIQIKTYPDDQMDQGIIET